MRAAAALFFLSFATAGISQDWARTRLDKSPRHLEWVTVKHGNREVKCFIGYPEVHGKATAVLVIHEIFGLTDWVRGVVDQLAEHGYIAIAPDLLSGIAKGGGGTDELGDADAVRKAISSLPPEQIIADLDATADYLKALPAANGKLTVIGFCWGGGQTWRFAQARPDLKLACPFYGTASGEVADYRRIACPVYGFYGGNDSRVNSTLGNTAATMKQANGKFEAKIYEGAGHGFMRAGEAPDATAANKKARKDAWKRLFRLLGVVTTS